MKDLSSAFVGILALVCIGATMTVSPHRVMAETDPGAPSPAGSVLSAAPAETTPPEPSAGDIQERSIRPIAPIMGIERLPPNAPPVPFRCNATAKYCVCYSHRDCAFLSQVMGPSGCTVSCAPNTNYCECTYQ